MVKKIGLIILMMFACVMPINANSIRVELQDSVDELSKENVEFRVVQVAKLVDGFFVLNEEFKDLDVDFNTELLAEEVEEICAKLSKYEVTGERLVTDEEGKAVSKYFRIVPFPTPLGPLKMINRPLCMTILLSLFSSILQVQTMCVKFNLTML